MHTKAHIKAYKIFCLFLVCLSPLFACDTPIHIRSNSDVPLSKIIEEIATQCHLNVIYLQENTKAMLDSKKSAIHINNKPLKSVLNSLKIGRAHV